MRMLLDMVYLLSASLLWALRLGHKWKGRKSEQLVPRPAVSGAALLDYAGGKQQLCGT